MAPLRSNQGHLPYGADVVRRTPVRRWNPLGSCTPHCFQGWFPGHRVVLSRCHDGPGGDIADSDRLHTAPCLRCLDHPAADVSAEPPP